jgi:ABC-type microcin C transport system duplicated ATPase subunit YejF
MTTPTPITSPSLLSAQVTVRYPGKAPVLRGISLEIARGEVVGLSRPERLGQKHAGAGNPRITRPPARHRRRQHFFQGVDLLALRERELRSLRGRSLSLVLQSPLASLNPALEIRTQLKGSVARAQRGNATAEDCDQAIQSA